MSLTNGFSSASGLDTDIRQMPGFQGNDGLAELKVAQPKPRNMTDEDEESLKELCLQNGLNYSKLQNGEVFNCTKLEMFFSGFPKIIGMRHFPSVTVLMLVDQPIKRIEGISSLNHLRELWIAECEITKIEHLGPLKRLKKLYLYDNSISTIENIDHLLDLEVLWLNNNQISNIENMSNLKSLAQLNISENRISKIGHTLDSNISLTELNISGNAIVSLRDLTNLMRLSNLTSLSLKDPVCSPCPVSLLCNYSTHILFHLQTLTQLDTYEISRNVAEMAETTVVKKKMYYNMRVKTTKRNLTDVLSKMKIYKDRLLEMPMDRVKNLKNALKEMQMQIEEMLELNEYFEAKRLVLENCNDEGLDWEEEDRDLLITKEIEMQAQLQKLEEIPSFSRKLAALNERLRKWERRCSELEFFHREAQERLTRSCDTMVKKMVLELESGGNVRFEEGSPSDVWFTSCQDLVLSRFCATDYKEHGITGVKIHRIIRVHNRMLRTQFDEKLSLFVDDNEGEFFPGSRNMGYKKLLEYLFSMWDPTLPSGTQEPMMILEEGFADADTYKSLNRDGAVPLSNSLSLADRHRIKHLTKLERSKEFSDNCPFRYGQLIISKVYLGKSVKALDERQITGNAYPKIDAVFKPRKMCLGTENQGDTIQTCECSARQCEWYVFDNELVLPEYVVEFEYITKFKSKSPFTYFSDLLLDNRECKPPGIPFSDEEKAEDENVMKMEPQAKPRPRLVALTDVLILKAAGTESVENITVLNLHGNCLSRLKPLHTLKYLCRLTVSFNELTRLDDLANMHLEYLDASFNKISTLDGFKNMTKLKSLDLSWNKLVHTREELSILRKHVCHLICLDLRNNPWQKPENLRLRVIGRLKSLMTLDGVAVNESESTLALRVAAGSRISQLSLFTHGRVDTEKPRSLSLMSNAQILEKLSRHKPEKQGENDILWYSKVTTLNLDDQHITKLSGLERMENLRWASFNNNDITKIEGLEGCVKLEELSLENNCISKLEGISKLVHLRRLSLGSNLISSLDGSGLHSLIHLHYLSLENNNLQSMAGLQKVPGLVELYIGNNDISSVREVFYLKSLANLVILDLYGNPVATEIDNYRLFVIYHLKYLKALDGTAIEASEGGMAKDTFGGRLTPDFVAEKLGHSTFHEVRELDLPNSAIRIVDLGAGDTFINLRSVNLEHNNLTSFSGLIHLPNIRVLCLNHNHIECIMPKPKTQPKSKPTPPPPPSQSANNMSAMRSIEYLNGNNLTPIMENLEVLHLGYNGIKDLAALQLSRLTSLKALFLQGNEITKVEGIEGLHDLRELVLDRNKVKNLSEMSFANQWNMQELHLEENRIRDLSYLNCMDRLQRLYLGSNRIQEVAELQKLEGLVNLIEISLVNNPAARRHLHRPLLVFKLANLLVIDGIPVTEEERAKAELYFMDQQPVVTTQGPAVEGALPGIGQYKTQIPVKVTTMNLGSSPIWNGGVLYDDNTTEVVQRGGGRRRQGTKENGSGTGLNRANTIVYQNLQQAQGYGAFTSNGNSRPQYFLNQTPYVNPTQSEYVEWFSRINQAKNNKR